MAHTPKTPPAHRETPNPFEAAPVLQTRPRMHKRTATGYVAAPGVSLRDVVPEGAQPEAWKEAQKRIEEAEKLTPANIEANVVGHIYHTLARASFNTDDLTAYQAVAYTVRDKLLSQWNTAQAFQTQAQKKKVYYFSLEWLQGRALDNALINLKAKPEFNEAIGALGFNLEDLIDCERDAGLGNGGLGRLASCYIDSMATNNIPGFGYGLRYEYGIFSQQINKDTGEQVEVPDPWLDHGSPWDVPRPDHAIEVRFYGQATRYANGDGRGEWTGGQTVLAVPYDMPIPGYETNNVATIRLWASRPKRAFDLSSFNAGHYDAAVAELNEATLITRVLYPNDNTWEGKKLRLRQQYFWVAASLHDIVRRFKKLNKPWSAFPDFNAIQLNDTHPTLSIVELQRLLMDEEELSFDDAWDIVVKTHGYTNHTVMPEALEKWPLPLIGELLPRILQIIYDVNLHHLQRVEKKWPGDMDRLARMSIIEESQPQQVRMANLAVVGSHHTNGVAALHSGLVKDMFQDFVELYGPDHFGNVTNGITPRRWLLQCNPSLADLVTKTLGNEDWVLNLEKLKGLEPYAKDPAFQKKFYECKVINKKRLADYVFAVQKRHMNPEAVVDIQVKRIHEYKRQTLNIFGVIWRYLQLKKLSPADRAKAVPRVSIFAGKAAPGYYIAKLVIRLINNVGATMERDPDIPSDLFQCIFLADYCVSLAEILCPAADISEHISTAGTEASGTSNMKFCLNGGLLLGTVDGASVEIAEEVGDENVFMFGVLTPEVSKIRYDHRYHPQPLCPELQEVFDEINKGTFGDPKVYQPLINTITQGGDYYLINDDFEAYLATQQLVDKEFKNKSEWIQKSILTTARMGKFSSDRCIMEYADGIWNAEPSVVPDHL